LENYEFLKIKQIDDDMMSLISGQNNFMNNNHNIYNNNKISTFKQICEEICLISKPSMLSINICDNFNENNINSTNNNKNLSENQ